MKTTLCSLSFNLLPRTCPWLVYIQYIMACFIRRISVASNAIQIIDNEA